MLGKITRVAGLSILTLPGFSGTSSQKDAPSKETEPSASQKQGTSLNRVAIALSKGNYTEARELIDFHFHRSTHFWQRVTWDDENVNLPQLERCVNAGKEIWYWEDLLNRGRDASPVVITQMLNHDIAQFEYLVEKGTLPEFFEQVASVYRKLLSALHKVGMLDYHVLRKRPDLVENLQLREEKARRKKKPGKTPVGIAFRKLQPVEQAMVCSTYGKAVYMPNTSYGCGASCISGQLLLSEDSQGMRKPSKYAQKLSIEYSDADPHLVVIDDVLSDSGLQALRDFCNDAIIWFYPKDGYVGAYMQSGFFTPAVQQLAEEFRAALPGIFCDHQLSMAWAYKYDNYDENPGIENEGIAIHADNAAVTINVWLTETEHRIGGDGGGLVVYGYEADLEAGEDRAQPSRFDPAGRELWGKLHSSPNRTVEYRANRALIFKSNLFHKTGSMVFAPGYNKRRINLTLLFGARGQQCGAAAQSTQPPKSEL